MDQIHSYCVDFLRDQNLIAQIEVAEEKQSSSLNISCYDIEEIPTSVFQLRTLKKLYIDDNTLYHLPESLSKLENLRVLAANHNNLTDLPSSLHQLRGLLHLNLSHNPLVRVPEVVNKLEYLESLWLNQTELLEMTTDLQNLKNLVTLGARRNLLMTYPPELCYFPKLRWLTLERNKIKHLPQEFQNLIGLKHLNLASNLFEEVPPCLVHVKNLQFCFMQDNLIMGVSDVMLQQMKHMKCLDLRENPISSHINRKTYPYVVLQNGQCRNTQLESSDSEDNETSIASSDINLSSGGSDHEPEDQLESTLPQVSRFAFSAA